MVAKIWGFVVLVMLWGGVCFGADEMAAERAKLEKICSIKDDLVYKRIGGIELKASVLAGKGQWDKKSAAVIFVHGGGWYSNTRDEMYVPRFTGVVERLIKADVKVVSFDYRLVRVTNSHFQPREKEMPLVGVSHGYAEIVRDCKDLVRWLYREGENFGIDPQRMGSWGGSAGGHLALMMAYTRDNQFSGDAELADYPSDLRCAVSWYGTTEFVQQYDSMQKVKGGPVPPLLGGLPEQVPGAYLQGSPFSYVRWDSAPVLLCHGKADPVVPFEQSVYLYERAVQVGAPVEFVEVENSGHNFMPRQGPIEPTLEQLHDLTAEFMIEHLK